MPEDKLPLSIQESITTAVALVNDDNATVIASQVEPKLFDEPLDEIISRSLDYRKQYNRAPGKQHIDDLFSDVLENTKHKLHQVYMKIINGMVRQADGLDTSYVLKRVSTFVHFMHIRIGLMEAGDRFNKGGDNAFDDLEAIFRRILRIKNTPRDYGFTLNEPRALDFLMREKGNDYCPIGIPVFDAHGVHPARKELLLFIAARNRGKSQFLNHCAKSAYLQGWRAIYYTLENSAEMTAMRLFQTLFNGVRRHQYTKDDKGKERDKDYSYIEFVNKDNEKTGFTEVSLKPNWYVTDKDDSLDYLKTKINEEFKLKNIRIRSLPTGRMSYNDLQKDLDELAIVEKFEPEVVLIDMPQLMRMPRNKQGWEALEELTIDLRGLAVDRNLAMVVPQQGTRSSESATSIQSFHGSGSIAMFGIADNAITYSQTRSEEEHGMARLFAAKVRNDSARFTVLITQHYPTGQFVMDSRLLSKDLGDELKKYIGEPAKGRDEDYEDDEPESITRG
jgi:hypothetical protein